MDHGADPPRSAAPPIYVPPCAFSDRSPDTAYELARRGEFPVPVICAGRWNWLGEPRNDSGRWNTPTEDGTDDPGLFDIPGQIRKAINDFFAWVVESALNPVLSPLGEAVLTTPDLPADETSYGRSAGLQRVLGVVRSQISAP